MKKNFIILLLIALIPIKAFALIEVDITRGNLNPPLKNWLEINAN